MGRAATQASLVMVNEAVGTLQTNHGVSQTRAELHALFLQLPVANVRRSHHDGCELAHASADAAETKAMASGVCE